MLDLARSIRSLQARHSSVRYLTTPSTLVDGSQQDSVDNGNRTPDYLGTPISMISLPTRRVLVPLMILAFIVLSTAAVAHGHFGVNSADESHCPLCMAVHGAKHAVTAPIVALRFTATETDLLVDSTSLAAVVVQVPLTKDRAPPRF